MRSPRSVTLAPMALPVRRRNWAMERLARVTMGFWPVMMARSPTAASSALAFCERLAEADVDDDLGQARHLHRVVVAELLLERGHDLVVCSAGAAGRSLALLLHVARAARRSWCRRARCGRRRPASWRMRVGCEQEGQMIMTLLDVERLGDVEDAALLDAGLAVRAALRLARLGVPLGDVDALDHDRGAGQRRVPLPAGSRAWRSSSSSPAGW